LIVNAVGEDRLGIVSDITGMVIACGGNVGESQAANMGGHFSLMMLVSVPSDKLPNLQAQLGSMTDMNASVFETTPKTTKLTPQIAYSVYFSLEGADHPGIVHKMTSALGKHGLSVDKMETDQEIAPNGGSILFTMRGIANACKPLASGFDPSKIKEELIDLGDALNCDVTMEDVVDDSYQGSFYGG
jgi:glycine cleavage system transcriptional repressor